MELGCELFGSGMLWWSALIAGMLLLLFWPSGKQKGKSALDILHEKFAEGALSVKEFQERKDILKKK